MRGRFRCAPATAPFAFTLLLTGCGSADGGGTDAASTSGGTGNQAAAGAGR
ncbi:hypothetical protein AB0I81_32905 [Nonomuraea sp. NPDC050404]|uniref:hypothetical protein n=1 Tax=Nonomuraea sp. NPDC050404 TaxID=3155783 RepID=UPI0033DF0CEB